MSLTDAYPWLKALHVAVALVFVGGVLAAAALLAAVKADAAPLATSLRVVRRWDRVVTTPAMILVYGIAANDDAIDAVLRYHHEQGITRRRYWIECIFVPYLLEA